MEWIKGSIAPEAGAFITQIIATLCLVVILRVFLWKPMKEFGQKRRDYIKKQYDDVEKLKYQSESWILEAEAKKNEINNDSDKIISDAKSDGEKIRAKAITDAKFEANRKIERADLEIEEAKQKAEIELKNQSAQLAEIIAQKLVKNSVNVEDNKNLVEEALGEVR